MRTSDTFALAQPEQETISYDYYADNLLKAKTDALGRRTAFDYDALGNLTNLTQLAGTNNAVTSTQTYDQTSSKILTATDPLGHTTYQYDSNGDLTQTLDPLGHTLQFSYNSQGLPTSVTDGVGNTTTFGYSGGDLSSIVDPLGNTTNLFTDQLGRLVQMTDAEGHITRYIPDNLNQITSITDAIGSNTGFSYDPNGNRLALTDALNHVTSYTYDNMDRVNTRTDPLHRQESNTYDLAGNLATFTDRKGQLRSYTFDGLRRLSMVSFGVQSGASGTTVQSTISYTYDAGNRLVQTIDSSAGTITHTLDLLDHLTSEATPQGSIGYTYDNGGRRLTAQVAGQSQVTYSWDDVNRLTGIVQGANGIAFSYDNANRRVSLTLPNSIVTSYSYDAHSNLTGISYSLGTNPIGNLSYTYDSLRRRTGMGGSLATTNLPQPVPTATYDAANELTNWDGIPVSYDANGNVVSDTLHTYAWDTRNQLASIDSGGAATYTYDAFGRRINKNISGVPATAFLYDGMNPVQEISGGTPTANLLTGNVDEYFMRTDSNGTWNLLSDALGSTLALADASGVIDTQYSYDPFGAGGRETTGMVSFLAARCLVCSARRCCSRRAALVLAAAAASNARCSLRMANTILSLSFEVPRFKASLCAARSSQMLTGGRLVSR
jgi:YD repeat-containing protein